MVWMASICAGYFSSHIDASKQQLTSTLQTALQVILTLQPGVFSSAKMPDHIMQSMCVEPLHIIFISFYLVPFFWYVDADIYVANVYFHNVKSHLIGFHLLPLSVSYLCSCRHCIYISLAAMESHIVLILILSFLSILSWRVLTDGLCVCASPAYISMVLPSFHFTPPGAGSSLFLRCLIRVLPAQDSSWDGWQAWVPQWDPPWNTQIFNINITITTIVLDTIWMVKSGLNGNAL
jgi:hypothetical protein